MDIKQPLAAGYRMVLGLQADCRTDSRLICFMYSEKVVNMQPTLALVTSSGTVSYFFIRAEV